MFNEKEKQIQTQRLGEATVKGYTGIEGKFGCILRYLGEPIFAEGSSMYKATYMDDVWDLPDENEIKTMEEDQLIQEVGRQFSALSRGVHLEITYNIEKEIMVYYKGYLVYKESAELECYAPDDEWERHVEKFYIIAKERENNARKNKEVERRQEGKREKLNFLEKIKNLWGIK